MGQCLRRTGGPLVLRLLMLCLALLIPTAAWSAAPLGSPQNPLRAGLIPADRGTQGGTRGRGCAELLAVSVENGRSTYYAGLFARTKGPVRRLSDLKGRRVAFGDLNSASSFIAPMAMLLDARIDPVRDLGAVRLTGSHANSLAALMQGQADAAALSFDSFEKAVTRGVVSGREVSAVARSAPTPNPPRGMSTRQPPTVKARLKRALATVAKAPGVTPDMIRGYGGKRGGRL